MLDLDKSLALLPEIVSQLDEPLGDGSLLPTYLLSRFTRQHVTVALGGDGGDELFAGYDPFRALARGGALRELVPARRCTRRSASSPRACRCPTRTSPSISRSSARSWA